MIDLVAEDRGEEFNDHELFLSSDSEANVAVSPGVNIQNILSPTDHSVDGDCCRWPDSYDGFLINFYWSHDFDVIGKMAFSPEAVPGGWKGTPFLRDHSGISFMAPDTNGVDEAREYDGSE